MKNITKSFSIAFTAIFFTGGIGVLTLCGIFVDGFLIAVQKTGWLGIVTLLFACAFITLVYVFIRHRSLFGTGIILKNAKNCKSGV